jgi:hypothetical protein
MMIADHKLSSGMWGAGLDFSSEPNPIITASQVSSHMLNNSIMLLGLLPCISAQHQIRAPGCKS